MPSSAPIPSMSLEVLRKMLKEPRDLQLQRGDPSYRPARLDRDEINVRFSLDEILRRDELPPFRVRERE